VPLYHLGGQLTSAWTNGLGTRELLARLPAEGPWSADEVEGDALEFKETPATTRTPAHALKEASTRLRTDLVETAVSFANARGGTVAIGVRDAPKAGERVVPGVDLDDWSPHDLRQLVHDRTSPHLLVEVERVTIHERHVMLVHVSPGPDIYGTTQGVFKRRDGDKNRPLDEPTMRALRAARGHYVKLDKLDEERPPG